MAAKNIVICCDGTNNKFGSKNTNVVRIAQIVERDDEQKVYYDPGVGTMPDSSAFTKAGKFVSKVAGLAFGRGLAANISDAYRFLMNYYADGDRVFIFGFSRGAYTARALAGLLHHLGLLRPGLENLVPYAIRMARGINDLDEDNKKDYWRTCAAIRGSFSRPVTVAEEQTTRFHVHFLGLWDTVSSVGWIWDPKVFPYTARNPSVEIVRHAVAIDERRTFYRQNLWFKKGDDATDVLQLWFPGAHSDVGGGYGDDGRLWQESLAWIAKEASAAELRLDQNRLGEILAAPEGVQPAWRTRLHKSLSLSWWPAEFFPKTRAGALFPRLGLGRRRRLVDGTAIHSAALHRIRDPDLKYRPKNLSKRFIEQVLALNEVPSFLKYKAG